VKRPMHQHNATIGSKYRILIIDDHPIVRRGLAELFNAESDLEVCGEAADVTEAMQLVRTLQPDMVLVDLSLQGGHGIDLIEQIKAHDNAIVVLVSSMHDEMLFAERAVRAGAQGYIAKHEPTETLIGAIRQVLRGELYLSPRMSSRLLRHVASGKSLPDDPVCTLSNREIEVFEMIGQGLTIQQIARKLELSPKTVETHREKIKGKLNLKNSAELGRRAVLWVLENRSGTSAAAVSPVPSGADGG
jgi:DNA-binding NarL/FixJ family response regulator